MGRDLKNISSIVVGNILDYYDFLLFAHLGYIITPFFMPNLDSKSTHLLSFMIFALPFIVRPIGGYYFGKLSDKRSRKFALSKTLKYASMASLAIAILPSYTLIGIYSSICFIFLRTMQGFSLGGEYTTAGTILIEEYPSKKGLVSGILSGSSTVGSFFAFIFAYLYLNGYLQNEQWRIAFFIGSIATFLSLYVRSKLDFQKEVIFENIEDKRISFQNLFIIATLGSIIAISVFIPTIYVNFYLTKILHFDINTGLRASLIAIMGFSIFCPVIGIIYDYFPMRIYLVLASISLVCTNILGFELIKYGNLYGQVLLILGAAIIGSPIHAIMNVLVPRRYRGRIVNTTFMIGTSFGGVMPFLSGYFADKYNFYELPQIIIITLSAILLFFIAKNKENLQNSTI